MFEQNVLRFAIQTKLGKQLGRLLCHFGKRVGHHFLCLNEMEQVSGHGL
jgi:hypothetical protein